MKTIAFAVLFSLCTAPVFAANTDPNYDQAREDYRIYLQELKKLGAQYRELTGEMKKVIAEEGVPTWSEADDSIKMVKPDFTEAPAAQVAAGTTIKQSNKDVTATLDLPGLDRKTLKVSIEDKKTLRIRGKRKDNGETVERLVALPVDAEGAEGKYEDGVLTVKAKKSEESKKEVVVPVS